MRKPTLQRLFLTGLLTLLPIWLTWVVVKFVFVLLSDISRPLIGPGLQRIADGCSTSEVAQQLFISQKTVKNHLASIYQKLDARDRTQAVLQAVRMGIVHLT